VLPDISMTAIVKALESIPPSGYYVLIFIGFTTEGTSFPLIHIPAIVMFLASAHLIAVGHVPLTAVILVSAAGATLGALITHLVGVRMSRAGGSPAAAPRDTGEAARLGGGTGGPPGDAAAPNRRFLGISPRQVDRVWGWLERYGALLAMAARWLGVLRPPILLGTGMAGISIWKVIPALALGALSYCAFYQFVALEMWNLSSTVLTHLGPETIILSAFGLTGVWGVTVYFLRRVKP